MQIARISLDTDTGSSDLVHRGKVRYIGHSTFPASAIAQAQWVARDRRLRRFVTEQPPYSILVRAIEADVLPTCARRGRASDRHTQETRTRRLRSSRPAPREIRACPRARN
jgi:aryl-alcohol dehydrogenase-like predicted oxidoreductase